MPSQERSSLDDVIDVYKKDVDITLIRENLKLTPSQRIDKLMAFLREVDELRSARRASREEERREVRDDDERQRGLSG
jgi:hypothetical protein